MLRKQQLQNKNNSEGKITEPAQQIVAAVEDMLQNNPKYIICRRNGLGIYESFNRFVKKDLRWYPYHLKVRHHLTNRGFEKMMSNSK